MTKLCTVNVTFEDVKKFSIYKTYGKNEYTLHNADGINANKDMINMDENIITGKKIKRILFDEFTSENKVEGPFISNNNETVTLAKLYLCFG